MHELLLVEDDDALGRGIRLALEGGGLRVTVCRTLGRAPEKICPFSYAARRGANFRCSAPSGGTTPSR